MDGRSCVEREYHTSTASLTQPHAKTALVLGFRFRSHPHAGGRTARHHATSPLRTSPHARPLVSALYAHAAPARYPPNHPRQALPRAMYRVCAPRHCCTRTCSALRSRCSAEGGVAVEKVARVHSQLAHVERVTHSSLLAVRRCLAGCVCTGALTCTTGAQVRAAGRRVVRGGGTCSHPALLDCRGCCEKPVQSNLTARTTGCPCAGDLPATLSTLSTHTPMAAAAKMNTRASLDGHTGHAHAPLGAHAHVHSGQHGVILGHVHTQQTNHLICCEAGRAGACPVC
jgi:hypothetical protein